MYRVLYENENHRVYLFTGLVEGPGVQSNQLLIEDSGKLALFDPGGELTYQPLSMAISRIQNLRNLDFIIATHQDPDIISSLDKWLMYTPARVVVSRLWERFLPHLIPSFKATEYEGRIIPVPDRGAILRFGQCSVIALAAHFLHSVGNLHFYDEQSRILFSGDVGASLQDDEGGKDVEDFKAHIGSMLEFHQRYMGSNNVCRLWVNMIRQLDVEKIVPQHGKPFSGKAMVNQFLDWFERLECGSDLMTEKIFSIPGSHSGTK